jgi:23S rRNA (cytidine1920-2'-O)/16S rRNA (cytidine1409-2'-O)-methyltransferase
VTVLERTNVRLLSTNMLAQPASLVLGDLSFISWSAALPAVLPLLTADARLLLLLKPQFELAALGRGEELERGVAVDAQAVRECLAGLYNLWTMHHLGVIGLFPAGLRGAQGNQEYFIALARERSGLSRKQYEGSIAAAQERSPG